MTRVAGAEFSRTSSAGFRWALSAALVIFAIGFWVGFDAMHTGVGDVSPGPVGDVAVVTVAIILGRNLGAAALLYSGVATAGVSTVIGLLMIAAFVGATLGTALDNASAGDVLGSIAWYAGVELVGLLICATAGLLPIARSCGGPAAGRRFQVYRFTLARSLGLAAVGSAVILVAAVIEIVVISAR